MERKLNSKTTVKHSPLAKSGFTAIAFVILPLLLILAACGTSKSNSEEKSPRLDAMRLVNSDVSTGSNRLIFSLKDTDGNLVTDPNLKMKVRILAAGSDRVASEGESDFIWIKEGERGLYVVNLEIPQAGQWEVSAKPSDSEKIELRALLKVSSRSSTPPIGTDAPRSQTKTSSQGSDLRSITTDPTPEPGLYSMTIANAVTSGRPSVIAFSTPARCSSNMCGPVLDVVKAVRQSHPEANFVHVEIFDEPQNLHNDAMVPAVAEWGLPTEPWVFVVDSAGKVAAKFESIVSAAELEQALAKS